MKKLLTTIILTSLFLTACTSKTQTDMINSGSDDISELLQKLIQKEKEINSLNKELDDCAQEK